ncbi:gamma-glutamylcyclotransferase family protein [Halomonas caseinilytica]|uniref:gamma-glutamylcyclotransferase family protein n=1 Tax=Halomonas caseinilytica TaxID=438744 RepID=UPI0008494BD0|nr:gamma-glutamylcyclotransferase family protein [Halomonas caseinilytica]
MMTLRRLGLLSLCLAPFAIAAWFWLTWLSPWTYERPDSLPAIAHGEHRLFVYGTLRYAPVRWLVYGRSGDPQPVELNGYQRQGLDLVPTEEDSVEGLMLTVDEEELARLDRYERLGIRYYREEITLSNGQRAWVYRRLSSSD